jgi:integrase
VLAKICDHPLYPIIVTALGTGLRRGEILALRWCDVDLDSASVRVERSLGEADDRVYFKSSKSEAGRRSVSLAPALVVTLREHRKQQLETCLALGVGRPADDALVFTDIEGKPLCPDTVSRDWANLVRLRKLPKVSFHGLRHTNVSLLVAAGLDVHTVSRRIGHASAALTLRTYTHLFRNREREAAEAIEQVLGTNSVPIARKPQN